MYSPVHTIQSTLGSVEDGALPYQEEIYICVQEKDNLGGASLWFNISFLGREMYKMNTIPELHPFATANSSYCITLR